MSTAGDVNGDGLDDLLIGAPNASPNGQGGAGQSYVLFGRDFTSSVTHQGDSTTGETKTDTAGFEMP